MVNKINTLQLKQIKWLIAISYIVSFSIDIMLNISFTITTTPSITLLMLLFWTTKLLTNTHFATAFVLGIFSDIAINSILGSHGLIFIIITFLILKVRHSFKGYPSWQQTSLIIFYLYIYQVFSWFILNPNLIDSAVYYWLSPLSAIIIWPILYKIMNLFTHKKIF
jgi:rod shape-determining protein MreD